jgi:hypothetical protein
VRDGNLATTNYGAATSFELKNDNAGSTFNRRVLLRFDQSSLAGALPLAARLVLSATSTLSTYTGWTLAVHSLSGSAWTENAVNWNTAPTFGPAAHTFGLSASRTDVVDVSELYLSLGGTSPATVNLGLTMQVKPVNVVALYASRENPNPALRPRLEIDAIPAEARFENWIAAHGSVPVAARGATDDPDGDGLANLLEMALGGDPSRGDSLQPMVFSPEEGVVRLTLPASQPLGFRASLESSTDLITWSAVPIEAAMITSPPDGSRVVSIPTGPRREKQFWRLKISPEPTP